MAELVVGTDCSGMDSPITVLKRLGVPHRHAFSSESDGRCRRYIERNFSPDAIFNSVFERPLHWAEQVDLYVCGPPCTASSTLNPFQPESGRDVAHAVARSCFEFIAASRPYAAIIENVPRLKTVRGGTVFRDLLALIDSGYDVKWKSLNARDHGCPQNRSRIYIVCVRRDNPHGWAVRFPEKETLAVTASDLLDPDATAPGLTGPQAAALAAVMPTDSDHVFNIQNSRMHARLHGTWYGDEAVAACITAKMPFMYSIRHQRRLTALELARLQGFLDDEVDVAHPGLPRMLGNAMNTNVLARVVESVMT